MVKMDRPEPHEQPWLWPYVVSLRLGSLLSLEAVRCGMRIALGKLLPTSYKSMLLPPGKDTK